MIQNHLCPLEFPIDPYGAMFESSYIAVLPFIPLDLLDELYNEIDPEIRDSI